MKFFIPGLKPDANPEAIFESICRFAEERMGFAHIDRNLRVYLIEYRRDGDSRSIQVGRDKVSGGLITAILETERLYLACTLRETFLKGVPLIIDRTEVEHVEHFEDYSPHCKKDKPVP